MQNIHSKSLFPGVHNQQLLMKLHLSIIQLLVDCIPSLKASQSIIQAKISPEVSSKTTQSHVETTHTKQEENCNSGDTSILRQNNSGENTEEEENLDKVQELLVVFEKKLQSSLMALIKIHSSSRSSKKG